MSRKEKIAVAFSGGKDSTMLVHRLLEEDQYEIDSLIVTISASDGRTTSHKVKASLVEWQAKSIGIPLRKLVLPGFTNAHFEKAFIALMNELREQNITKIAYGDLFLEDVRKYKERLFRQHGFELLVPLWGVDSKKLIREFLDLGYEAYTVCVDTKRLDRTFLGKKIDHDFLKALPDSVDPCGENGEYHSFVFKGPIFKGEIPVVLTENIVEVDQRWVYREIELSFHSDGEVMAENKSKR